MKTSLGQIFSENLSYKLVALGIALVLWITILGRRDMMISKDMELEFQVNAATVLTQASSDKIRLKLSGSRNSLRRFVENGAQQVLIVDLSGKAPGSYSVDIPTSRLDLPFGVKLVSVRPESIQVQIGRR